MAVYFIVCIPVFFLPRKIGLKCMNVWSATSDWLLAKICGLKLEIRGQQYLPHDGALLASKHQSAWETLSFLHILPRPAMVLKKELIYLPFFGWYIIKMGMLWVDRGGQAKALRQLLTRARASLAEGRQIMIFPEGTRKAPHAEPDYQRGIAALYRDLKTPCVPVALNSGVFWRRRDWKRHPGTIIVEFLEPIPPGLDAKTFMRTLESRIEKATDQLVAEAESHAE